MYVVRAPNRGSPPAVLRREGYREDGKVKTDAGQPEGYSGNMVKRS